ncbi:deoxyhypusine hydroxylase, putative [Plasmodium knowlesi strain H]|uniref:Deoxyhypusine hydroxylase n=3 Tax=Plasmodium knowlesi TaxID=5850 RepID=A0A5K1V9L4_PLAKH|nr:deoxyhypusine hydroxylase, putative [Plasmodium knowlesi strain H]OTN64191.1 Deoxyhypusine hydroxylase [Plasmodium knowlesi]CAA9990627.1 deoxyhypusine hydroxylase, putative [Plasmodium knowlesi strain H]SBO26031.1 deoxyhypusine hydroxylase, putative [Plasmodium knowlesi strain H]SBO28731.1 deoxyhypusine hydroxylase, putative [Plasmodium knowlesi strain H]VVS80101.1 deoxyhypusine hydroxylase, putative [Plasmodium knowlesi strain H]|eukprot:XP_002261918.1 pbs lyase heat-like repeat domain protein,putative [Plasmodium knowlesi strain H]
MTASIQNRGSRLIQYEDSSNKEFIRKYLVETRNEFIEKQMRALYECREIYKHDIDEVINILTYALENNDSVLLRHEVAYVIGQISNEKCNDILIKLLSDTEENLMVRHEAAEGLAAIGSDSNIDVIKKFLNDEKVEVRETCELALSSLLEKNKYATCSCSNKDNIKEEIKKKRNEEFISKKFNTIDPVVFTPNDNTKSVDALIEDLNNERIPLKLRYEALFKLRDMETDMSINALGEVLIKDRKSAIFRHEVAFVLGQALHLNSLKYLISSLQNVDEHEMVRHEVALALGSLGSLNINSQEYKNVQSEIISTLKTFSKDACRVVSESCLVGLDYIAENLNMAIEIN